MQEKMIRDWLGLVVLPMAVFFATVVHQQSEEKQLEQRHRDEVALKFIELGWEAIQSHDSIRTRDALRILAVFDPVMAKQLALVALDRATDQDSVAVEQPDSVDHAIVRAGLVGLKVTVTADGENSRTLPLSVAKYIGHLQGRQPLPIKWVRYSARKRARWSVIHYPTSLEQEALALQRLLEVRFPQLVFNMVGSDSEARSMGIMVIP